MTECDFKEVLGRLLLSVREPYLEFNFRVRVDGTHPGKAHPLGDKL